MKAAKLILPLALFLFCLMLACASVGPSLLQ